MCAPRNPPYGLPRPDKASYLLPITSVGCAVRTGNLRWRRCVRRTLRPQSNAAWVSGSVAPPSTMMVWPVI